MNAARKLRIIGGVILLLGLAGAGSVYWFGTRTADLSEDASMTRFNRPEQQQMTVLYGKQGALIEDLSNALKQPGTQAGIIGVMAALVSGACFYFARVSAARDKSNSPEATNR